MNHQRLRLRARDAEDLTVFSSILQDAIVPVTDIAYVPDERRFAMVANRFLWESAEGGGKRAAYQRVNCGVVVEKVAGVKSRGLNLTDRGRMLDLLTLQEEDGGVRLVFSGDTDIWLDTESIDVTLEDLGEPWPTQWRPDHADLDSSES